MSETCEGSMLLNMAPLTNAGLKLVMQVNSMCVIDLKTSLPGTDWYYMDIETILVPNQSNKRQSSFIGLNPVA